MKWVYACIFVCEYVCVSVYEGAREYCTVCFKSITHRAAGTLEHATPGPIHPGEGCF